MSRLRRKQTIYLTLDSFMSPRGKTLHHFEQFLSGVAEAEFPCVWLTGMTRAQLDEPRRRLGHSEPFIGESGCGVYLPEDYFHLKSRDTVRMGRFTVIPIAKPQPAAAEALQELSGDTDTPVVSFRSLSLRELSQNTGLPTSEAERIRMRDFDELFFFAGADAEAIRKFQAEVKARGLTLQNSGSFWSLSVGADLGKCIRELGGLYDRALRTHALRVGLTTVRSEGDAVAGIDPVLKTLASTCDRVVLLCERQPLEEIRPTEEVSFADEEETGGDAATATTGPEYTSSRTSRRSVFHLHAPGVWDDVVESLVARS